MHPSRRTFLAQGIAATALVPAITRADSDQDSNVVLVTTDGLRWQDVFRGADPALMERTAGDAASAALIKDLFWRETPEKRRAALMPFFWNTIARQGQLHGNRDAGSDARLTNGLKFSYPGYNEMLTGAPDPRINSNDKIPNANTTVLEWLDRQPGFQGRVAAFCCWDVFPFILNRARAGFPIVAGWERYPGGDLNERERTINDLFAGFHREWDNNIYDAFTFEMALAYLERHKPRVLYIALGETDEHSHHNRYDFYLRAAHRVDAQLARLWKTLQSMPEYRDKTSLVVTTDHGRGEGDEWTSHGEKIEGAEFIWAGILGPHAAPPLAPDGSWPAITQSQIAATVAGLVGCDFQSAGPNVAPPIPGSHHIFR